MAKYGQQIQQAIPEEGENSSFWDTNLARNRPTWRYAYDGQMPVYEDYTRYEGGQYLMIDATRSFLGGRGIDMIERQRMSDKNTNVPGAISRVFPLYDGHGNTMAEIVRTGPTSADFVQGSLRKYDAWGNSRLNSAPSGFHGYCGNLGHKEDPESGLTYMRARYYEPGTGRFISEDPARDGINWYGYCGGNPVDRVDPTGRVWAQILGLMAIGAIFGLLTYAIQKGVSGDPWTWQGAVGYTVLGAIALPLVGVLGAVVAAKGAALTALALGEVLLWEVVAGILGLASTGIQATIDKGEKERLERRGMKGGVDTVIAASLGQQMLILMYLGDIE